MRITDLGDFCTAVFAAMVTSGEHGLSRLQFGTGVCEPDGRPVGVPGWLAAQAGGIVDRPIRLGLAQQLGCRLIAWRLPPEPTGRRRQK